MARVYQPDESQVTVSESDEFVAQETPDGMTKPAYRITVPEEYVITFRQGTLIAPEFRDASGNKLDDSTRVVVQIAGRRGDAIGGAVLFDGVLSNFNYTEMLSDQDFVQTLNETGVLDEREQLHVYVDEPNGQNFDHGASNLNIGDSTGSVALPVSIANRKELPDEVVNTIEQINR